MSVAESGPRLARVPAVSTEPPESVSAGTARGRVGSFLGRRGVRSALRLGLIATYSIVFMWGGFFDWAGWTETFLWSAGAILWIVVAALLVREARRSGSFWRYVVRNPSLPILLVAPAFLWFVWMPIVAFLLVVVAYILELRNHSAGDGFWFSFGLVLFVGVFAGLSMVEVENEAHASSLRSPSDAMFWAFASLLKLNYGRSLSPETSDGRILATVVGVCALIGASLFTAQLVKWIVGSEQADGASPESGDSDDGAAGEGPAVIGDDANAAILAELRAIRSELAELRGQTAGADSSGTAPASGGTLVE